MAHGRRVVIHGAFRVTKLRKKPNRARSRQRSEFLAALVCALNRQTERHLLHSYTLKQNIPSFNITMRLFIGREMCSDDILQSPHVQTGEDIRVIGDDSGR